MTEDIFTMLAQMHSPTSITAAIGYARSAPNARLRVFRLLERTSALFEGGLTDEEIQDALRMSANTQRPRRVELQRAGLVQDSGRTRATRSGAAAVIWTVTGKPYPTGKWPSRKDGG